MDTTETFNYIKTFADPREWRYIIIHHSWTTDGFAADWDAIRRYHKESNGWRDIGYHFGIESVKGELVYQIGRPLSWEGAHTIGRNKDGIGICVVGNFDPAAPSDAQMWLLTSLCRELMHTYKIPIANVLPHWAYEYKSCPGKSFNVVKLRDLIMQGK